MDNIDELNKNLILIQPTDSPPICKNDILSVNNYHDILCIRDCIYNAIGFR